MVFKIKGTADSDIAWQQLKVSSKSRHALLTSGLASVLRVTDVFGREPVVHELRHGRDFLFELSRENAARSRFSRNLAQAAAQNDASVHSGGL